MLSYSAVQYVRYSRWYSKSRCFREDANERTVFGVRSSLGFSRVVCSLPGGSSCPNASALQETRSCNEHPCVVYHWQTGAWGPCTEDTSVITLNSTRTAASGQDKTSCATGMQTRKVICVKVNVGQVPPKK